MAGFKISNSEFEHLIQNDPTKLYHALKHSIEKHDYDSGVKAKPADGVFRHGLGVVPKEVIIQGSDTQDVSSYVQENASAVTNVSVTVGGSKAFYRVLANR